MSKLPSATGRDVVKAFKNLGFVVDRVRGSHHVMKSADNPVRISVPIHGNESLKKGTLRSLIRDAGITVERFIELLEK